MSYILDALNKSEQERAKKRTPDLHSLGRKQANSGFGFKQLAMVIIIIAAINILALWYFFGDHKETAPIVVQPAVTQPSTADPVISNVPATSQRATPQVEVTAHIYAEDADLRMVKIDGESRKEGELIKPGLTLVEITESGVILNYEGEVYVMDIVEDWQLY